MEREKKPQRPVDDFICKTKIEKQKIIDSYEIKKKEIIAKHEIEKNKLEMEFNHTLMNFDIVNFWIAWAMQVTEKWANIFKRKNEQ